jgi:nicotinate-nucleotide adenylyltransferase
MSRVGILGGTFDPPHFAHLVMAEEAAGAVPLDKVLFMPAPCPPHKTEKTLTPYALRLEMVKLLVAGHRKFEISRLEEFRDGPSYTVDLLRHYRREHDDELFLIIGADSLKDFPSWKDPEEILRLATLVVYPRTGYPTGLALAGDAPIVLSDAPAIDVSSSDVRRRFASGRSVERWLPAAIHEFIIENGLYGDG